MKVTSLDIVLSRPYQVLKIFLEDPAKERFLEEMNAMTPIPKMTLYRILKDLEKDRWLKSRSDGYRRYWRMRNDHAIPALKVLMNVDSKMIRELILHFKDSTLILYGSRARGTDTKDSDWDLLLVEDGMDPVELNSIVNRIEKKHSVTLDVKNYTTEQYSRMKKEKTTFYMEIRSSMYLLAGDPDGL